MPFNVQIIGHMRHGKDTVADLLVAEHGYRHVSASQMILEHITYPILGPLYSSHAECYEDRVNHRSTWFDLIKARLANDPQFLARMCLNGGHIFTGTRSRFEYEAIKGLFDFTLFVRRDGYPPEPSTSMELSESDADFIIYNDAGLADLRLSVAAAVQWMKERRGI
jgi:hypothetical protein